VIAPSNVAAANIANKVKAADRHGKLLLRPWSSCEEENALIRYVPGGDECKHVDSSPWRGHDRFIPEMSVPEAVLMMCGQLPTTNQKLLSLREHNAELAQTLATHPGLREIEMKSDLRSRARRAAKAVMSVADAFFTTSAQALSDLVKPFTKSAGSTVIEEAGNAVDAEITNSHNGDQKDLTLVGDPKQLPPPSIAEEVRHPPPNAPHQRSAHLLPTNQMSSQNGRPVDPFTDRMQTSLMDRLIKGGWPVVVLNQQLRMVAGGFNLASRVIYSQENIVDGLFSSLSNHPMAVAFEKWTTGFPVKASPSSKVLPIMIDLRGTTYEIE
jgi:hypothetical protein